MTDGPRYGCGRDCSAPRDFDASGDPAPPLDPDAVVGLDPETIRCIEANSDARILRSAWHESGHCVGACLHGRSIEFAVTGRTPHVLYGKDGPRTEEAIITATIAGRVAEGLLEHNLAPPSDEEMQFFIEKVHAGTHGSCDSCNVATALAVFHSTEDDTERRRRWRDHYRRVADLFDDVFIRSALARLARALQERIRLDRPEIEQLIGHLRPESDNAA